MRKTLPALFLMLIIAGALCVGFAASWLFQSGTRSNLELKEAELSDLRQNLAKKNEEMSKISSASKADKVRAEQRLSVLSNQRGKFEQDLQQLQSKYKQQNIELQKSMQRLTDAQAERDAIDAKLKSFADDMNTSEQQLANTQEELKQTTVMATTAEQALKTAQEKLAQATKKLEMAEAEKDILFAEVDRYSAQSKTMLETLGKDVGGLDVLLTPEFKSNFAEFLNDIGLNP